MAAIQIILTQDVKKLGRMHEAVSVKPGYAINYLIPKGMAVPATAKRLEVAEKKLEAVLIQKERILEKAEEVKKMIEDLKKIQVSAKVSDKDTLYGSVAEKEIAEEVEEQIKVRLENKHIVLPEHIKKTGEYPVTIRLGEGITADLVVEVLPIQQ